MRSTHQTSFSPPRRVEEHVCHVAFGSCWCSFSNKGTTAANLHWIAANLHIRQKGVCLSWSFNSIQRKFQLDVLILHTLVPPKKAPTSPKIFRENTSATLDLRGPFLVNHPKRMFANFRNDYPYIQRKCCSLDKKLSFLFFHSSTMACGQPGPQGYIIYDSTSASIPGMI